MTGGGCELGSNVVEVVLVVLAGFRYGGINMVWFCALGGVVCVMGDGGFQCDGG